MESSTNQSGLAERMRFGDQTALTEAFEKNLGRLQRLVAMRLDRRLKGRIEEADVLQDVFLTLSKRLETFSQHPKMTPYVWMRLTVMDRLISLHRKHVMAEKRDVRREVSISQKTQGEESSAEIAATLADSVSSIGGKVAKAEITQLIQSTLQALDPKDREIITMRIFEGMDQLGSRVGARFDSQRSKQPVRSRNGTSTENRSERRSDQELTA